MHDADAVRDVFAELPRVAAPLVLLGRNASFDIGEILLGHWQPLFQHSADYEAALVKLGPQGDVARLRTLLPFKAYALALSGNIAAARRRIAETPDDCIQCLRMRGRIEMLARDWRGGAGWFARAIGLAPSLPQAYCDWGAMLLAKGDVAAAIDKFVQAHGRSPHFADPLEMWGEALIAQNRSDLALGKFEEAARGAPRWGRLHLKWGEALLWLGRKDEARAQFALAAGLDLDAGERAQLHGDSARAGG